MYAIIVHDQHKTHALFDNRFDAAKVARKLNAEHGFEYCYVYGENEKQVYNPRYCRPLGERFGSPG